MCNTSPANCTSSITNVPGIKVGHAHNEEALTGCTVVLVEEGAVCGVDVRGAAPGTRETDLLNPVNMVQQVHAICLAGGSAFGLDAASGVMRYLEEHGFGLDVGVARVPIVPAAVLFDLGIGNPQIRPDSDMGYLAASRASATPVVEGCVGAGCGATVGKLLGFQRAMKSGIGSCAFQLPGGLIVGALIAVNAIGEVRDPDTGKTLAGPRAEDGRLLDSLTLLVDSGAFRLTGTNTTIGVVATNARLTKAEATKVAQMAHDGLATTIRPIHTMHDGDTLFALATGKLDASADIAGMVDIIGSWAAKAVAQAVVRAVKTAKGTGAIPAWQDLQRE